jgi:nucleotide-binding universal stress UspA family protein
MELTDSQLQERREGIAPYRVLVCIDGSEESYRALEYSAKMVHPLGADVVLLYVRPTDQGLATGGLQISVARQNMLDWGLELPGIRYLKKGRDLLIKWGEMADDWDYHRAHVDVAGDPLGDNKTEYVTKSGREVVLKLKVASGIATGVLEQTEIAHYDLIVLGASERWQSPSMNLFRDPAVAEKVAVHAPCSVLISRGLKRTGHGHLVCTDGSERADTVIRKEGELAKRCAFPLSVISVARDEEDLGNAEKYVTATKNTLTEMGVTVENTYTPVGDPVREIVETGKNYSLIALADTGRSDFQRFFMGSVAFQVMEHAENSVMIVRETPAGKNKHISDPSFDCGKA